MNKESEVNGTPPKNKSGDEPSEGLDVSPKVAKSPREFSGALDIVDTPTKQKFVMYSEEMKPDESPKAAIPAKGDLDEIPAKGDLDEIPAKEELDEIPAKENLDEISAKGNLEEIPAKGDLEEIPAKGDLEEIPAKGDLDEIPAKGDLDDTFVKDDSPKTPPKEKSGVKPKTPISPILPPTPTKRPYRPTRRSSEMKKREEIAERDTALKDNKTSTPKKKKSELNIPLRVPLKRRASSSYDEEDFPDAAKGSTDAPPKKKYKPITWP